MDTLERRKKTERDDTTNRKSKTTGLEYISRLGDSQKRHPVLFGSRGSICIRPSLGGRR